MTKPEQPPDPTSSERTPEPASGEMRRTQRGLAPRYLALEQEPAAAGQEPKTKRGFGAALKLMRALPLGKTPQAPAPIVVPSLARTDPGWGPNNPGQVPKTLRGFRFVEGRELAPQPDDRRADESSKHVGPPPLAPHLGPRVPQPSAADTPAFAQTQRQSPASVARAHTMHTMHTPAEPRTVPEHRQTIIVSAQDLGLDSARGASNQVAHHAPRSRAANTEQMPWGLRTQRPGDESNVDRLAGAFRWTAIASNLFDERNAPEAGASAYGERRARRLAIVFGSALVVGMAFGVVYPARVSVRAPAVLQDASAPQPLAASTPGTVHALGVSVGDEVHAAQVLLTFDAAALEAERAGAARELERANQRTHELEEARGGHERKAQELRAQVDASEQSLHAEAARLKRLRERRAALQSLEEQGSVVEKSIAVLSLEIGSAEENVRALERELSRAQLQLATLERARSEQLQSAGADLDAAQRAGASADARLEATRLRAPRGARIHELTVHVGDAVQAGQTLVKLGSLAPPTHAVAFVAARDLSGLRVGQAVQLELAQRALQASVQSIAARAEANGTHRVELTVQNSDATLRPGTSARLRFTAKRGPALLRWLGSLPGLFDL